MGFSRTDYEFSNVGTQCVHNVVIVVIADFVNILFYDRTSSDLRNPYNTIIAKYFCAFATYSCLILYLFALLF